MHKFSFVSFCFGYLFFTLTCCLFSILFTVFCVCLPLPFSPSLSTTSHSFFICKLKHWRTGRQSGWLAGKQTQLLSCNGLPKQFLPYLKKKLFHWHTLQLSLIIYHICVRIAFKRTYPLSDTHTNTQSAHSSQKFPRFASILIYSLA